MVARVEVPVTVRVPPTLWLPVIVPLVAVRLVIVALVVVELPMIALVMLAKVATRDEMNPLVVVAFVVALLVLVIPVIVATVAMRLEMKEFVEVELVKILPVEKRLVAVALITIAEVADKTLTDADEIVVVARVEVPVTVRVPPRLVCPDTVSAVAEALPRDDVPEMIVENDPVVNDGLGDTAMVLVPEKMMFAPAMRLEIGLL